ncbi:MAG: glycosyl hydrolase, partial [Acidobacteria bacterium]|nr:glycosyl hydrolase [Acidobacteriota bacterium]
CPGWSQSGGPWVKPEQSMRFVTMSETRLTGPAAFTARLPAPTANFQDIAVLAFPAPKSDTDAISRHAPTVTATPATADAARLFDGNRDTTSPLPQGASQVEVAVAAPFTARSLTLHPAPLPFRVDVELQAQGAGGNFATVKKFVYDRSNPGTNVGPMPWGPVAVAFPAVTSRRFRLVFTGASKPGGFGEIELSGAARLERFVEKQLGKMWQTPSPLWDAYLWPAQTWTDPPATAILPGNLLNLTSSLTADGTLNWKVPPGDWVVLRTGMAPTGVTNAPASPEGTGLEIDKMNRGLVRYHFNQFLGKLLQRIPSADRQAMGHVIADSYETGAQNWTDGLAPDFLKRYGYDPLPWLPVLSGRIVQSADASDRFLWDLRRLVADRISYDYVGGLRDVAAEHGLRLWLENYGHWGYPGEFLQYGGQSVDLGGEFWEGRGLGNIELRAATSAGHIYGKPIISAEAFTGGPAWQSTPWSLKARGDWATAQGINHFVLHVYIHQPNEDRVPGISAWFGTEFNRFNTWFAQAHDWIGYLRRTHFLLQQGRSVADVAYFIGEDAPKMTGQTKPELPEGYGFDYINAEAIEQRLTVKDGRFLLPDGTSYRLLVLPDLATMRPAVLRKLRDLVHAGGAILGPRPERSPSLENYPACDLEVKQLAAEIWRNTAQPALPAMLNQLSVTEDLSGVDRAGFPWTHRTAPEGEIYFISHQGDRPAAPTVSFRVQGRQPEVWDAVTGERRDLPDFHEQHGRTVVP